MGSWRIWGGADTQRRYKGAGEGLVTKCSTIMRSTVITSITNIKLTTTTIGSILLFWLRVIGLKIIGPTGAMPNYWNWQRSMQITYGGTWLTELMWSLSWIFGASWDARWSRKELIKIQILRRLTEDV